jgi:hypothetical protein
MTRRVRFFPDYGGADPVWDENGVEISLDRLPVRPDTKATVRDWYMRWERAAMQRMDAEDFAAAMSKRPVNTVTADVWRALAEEGRRLCARVQEELGPDWEVSYQGPQ